jgi:proteasome lid subunit RPN8/RPN11
MGILVGREVEGKMLVIAVLVPPQKGSSDRCEMTGNAEELLLQAHIQLEGITVGWIHTHPEFDCFLSSIDLHTSYRIQKDVKSAVAIVYSRLRGQFKAFRVKDSCMKIIGSCKEVGFHKHLENENDVEWEECSHVKFLGEYESPRCSFQDLRSPPGQNQDDAAKHRQLEN